MSASFDNTIHLYTKDSFYQPNKQRNLDLYKVQQYKYTSVSLAVLNFMYNLYDSSVQELYSKFNTFQLCCVFIDKRRSHCCSFTLRREVVEKFYQ